MNHTPQNGWVVTASYLILTLITATILTITHYAVDTIANATDFPVLMTFLTFCVAGAFLIVSSISTEENVRAQLLKEIRKEWQEQNTCDFENCEGDDGMFGEDPYGLFDDHKKR